MAIALAIFLISLVGIVTLFALKFWEVRVGRVIAPALRARADQRAQEFKVFLARVRNEAEHLLPTLLRILNGIIRVAALSAASAARYVERELHRLADMVSHKRNFQPRERQNDFLKQVSEHPIRDTRSNGTDNNGNGGDSESTPV
jgi:hypothetical protein